MSDSYGSVLRNSMKRSMERPAGYWAAKASIAERYRITLFQRIVLAMLVICVSVELAYQVGLRVSQ